MLVVSVQDHFDPFLRHSRVKAHSLYMICCCVHVISLPLKSLDEVRSWKPSDSTGKCHIPLAVPAAGEGRAKLLACHDFKGGYLDDRFVSTWFSLELCYYTASQITIVTAHCG